MKEEDMMLTKLNANDNPVKVDNNDFEDLTYNIKAQLPEK